VSEPQSFWTHLDDLRSVIIKIGLAFLIGIGLSFAFAKWLFQFLIHPYVKLLASHDLAVGLQTLEPTETFKISIQIAILTSLLITSPYTIKQLWSFISPGLTAKEKKAMTPLFFSGVILFLVGATFAYMVILPLSLNFFWNYSLNLGIQPGWTVAKYFAFVLTTIIAFGISFELPIVTTGLSYFGLITEKTLSKGRKVAFFIILLTAAFLTPPDVISQVLMAIPLVLLYELSIVLAKIVEKRKKKAVK
jgi:sec-independent protein translocase protein TatC